MARAVSGNVEAVILAQCCEATFAHEGGISKNKHDRGGITKYGVTAAVARKHGYDNVASISPEQALEIYRKDYFVPAKCLKIYHAVHAAETGREVSSTNADHVAMLVCSLHFDSAINHGTGAAVKMLQGALNLCNRRATLYADIVVDGGYGARTQKALVACLRKQGARRLFSVLLAVRGKKFVGITKNTPSNEEFIVGWLARLEYFYKQKFAVFGK